MSTTYRAVEVARPGLLQLTQRPLKEPTAGQVRIRVEACGVCHSDSATVDGVLPGITFPRVPGHEVVGKIDAIGPGVSGWKIGQRVGVGFLGGHCGQCQSCRRGDFVNCTNQPVSGAHFDGGYAEVMMAFPNGLVAIPEGLSSVEAAPLLCAGITTFNALRRSGAIPGDLVAILALQRHFESFPFFEFFKAAFTMGLIGLVVALLMIVHAFQNVGRFPLRIRQTPFD